MVMTMKLIKSLDTVSPIELSRAALFLANKIIAEYNETKPLTEIWKYDELDCDEKAVVKLFIWRTLCELKEFGQLKTHPEDLIRRCAANLRAYEYRGYHVRLKCLGRAFTNLFTDFQKLPRKEWFYNFDDWKLYTTDSHEGNTAKMSDYGARCFYVEEVPCYKDIGEYVVSERYPSTNRNGMVLMTDFQYAHVVPFKTLDEANFFISQLVDLLNNGEQRYCSESADCNDSEVVSQFVRNVITQVPFEKMRMAKEEAVARQREEERIRRIEEEKSRAKEQKKALHEKMLSERGTRVYIFEMENHTVKFGMSDNIKRRLMEIRGHSGMQIIRGCCTENLDAPRTIESTCHKHFDEKRRYKTEFFDITFEEAIAYLKTLAPVAYEWQLGDDVNEF